MNRGAFLLFAVVLTGLFATNANAAVVQLTTGERLNGNIISQDELQVVIEHEFLGNLVIPANKVVAVMSNDQAAAAPLAATEAATAAEPEPAAEEIVEAEEKEWKSQLEVGLNAATGNTEKLDFRAIIRSIRETDEERTKLEGAYFTAKADGDKTQNEFKASVLQDWYFGESPWLLNADAAYEYDDFESWRHRLSGHIGPGYKLIREEDLDVTLRSGVGAYKEWGSDEDSVQFEGKLGGELTWRISENQTFNSSVTFYPSFSDFGEYRAIATADYTIKLDKADGLSLKIGVEDEYESETSGDAEHNDLKVYAALLFDF